MTWRMLSSVGGIAAVAMAIPLAFAGCTTARGEAHQGETATRRADQHAEDDTTVTETATFGAGCFWGVEERFRTLSGVTDTEVGYAGGHTESPTYQQVCSHTTGHAEVVQVQYDPDTVTYEKLLTVFFTMHDPTQVNRQGPDVGDQYRSVILYHSESQKRAAEKMRSELDSSGEYRRPIATQILPAPRFWPAEQYHQEYFARRGGGACHF